MRRDSDWFVSWGTHPNARLQMFCFPFAGGSASTYRDWSDLLPDTIEVYAAKLPGRESRINEPVYTRMRALVDSFIDELQSCINGPYALFGHSMGAAIAFETATRLTTIHKLAPQRLFVSARRPPHLQPNQPPYYALDDEAFRQRLRSLNGTPPEVLEHPELMELFLPVLRGDFELNHTYRTPANSTLDCPVTVFGGANDKETSYADLSAWAELTRATTNIELINGDHFYIKHQRNALLECIGRLLSIR